MGFRHWLFKRRIHKVVEPLQLYNYNKHFDTQTDYLLDWLNNVGLKSIDISNENEFLNILAINVLGNRKDVSNLYCISLMTEPNMLITEEQLSKLKDEATICRGIPVIIVANNLGYCNGAIAHALGIQVITSRQIMALNKLLDLGKLPKVDYQRTQFLHKMAYYMRRKVEGIGYYM